jgi:hypothetical protein
MWLVFFIGGVVATADKLNELNRLWRLRIPEGFGGNHPNL